MHFSALQSSPRPEVDGHLTHDAAEETDNGAAKIRIMEDTKRPFRLSSILWGLYTGFGGIRMNNILPRGRIHQGPEGWTAQGVAGRASGGAALLLSASGRESRGAASAPRAASGTLRASYLVYTVLLFHFLWWILIDYIKCICYALWLLWFCYVANVYLVWSWC